MLSPVRLSSICLSIDVAFVHPTQPVEIFGNVPAAKEWPRLLLSDVVCSERVTMRRAAELTIPSLPGVMGVFSACFVVGDFDL